MTQVYIAIVTTEHGTDVHYAGKSEENAYHALANYCRGWWAEEEVDMETGIEDPSTLSDADVIPAYFNSEVVLNKGETGVVEVAQLQDE